MHNIQHTSLVLPCPDGQNSHFFARSNGDAVSYAAAQVAFQKVRKEAGVLRTDGARFQPRLHDIRHTFAVHRLLAWYREGADVQSLLPHLSTYLGHGDVRETQPYLSMIPELLNEASNRFERYALLEVKRDKQ